MNTVTAEQFQAFDFFKREVFEEVGDDYFSDAISLEVGGAERTFNFSVFLNGRCDEFAVALVRRYGGKLVLVTHHDDEGQFLNLAHAYVIKRYRLHPSEVVDIRGRIQPDSDLMMIEYFEDFYFGDHLYEQAYELEEGIQVLCVLLRVSPESYADEQLKEANHILDWFAEKYRY